MIRIVKRHRVLQLWRLGKFHQAKFDVVVEDVSAYKSSESLTILDG